MKAGDIYQFDMKKNGGFDRVLFRIKAHEHPTYRRKDYIYIFDGDIVIFLKKTTFNEAFPNLKNYGHYDQEAGVMILFKNQKVYMRTEELKRYFKKPRKMNK